MYAYALLVSVVLSGQLRAADERYNGQPTTGNNTAANPAGNANGSGLLPLGNPAAPANGGTGGGAAPATSGGSTNPNPFRSSTPTGTATPRALSPLDSNNTAPVSGPSGSTPAAYEVAPNPPANTAASAQPGAGLTPSAMMRAMLSAPNGSQLRGQPLTLVDFITGARTRAEQTQRVDAYWDLCSSVADYYLGLREQEELRRYVQRNVQAWDQVDLGMRNRTATSQRAALASQMRVASLMGRGNGYLPLPADAPHCASYNAHFEQIFAQGSPAEARELAALLPLRYKELQNAAVDVTKSEQWLDSFAAARGGNGDDGLHALELLALHRRAFVQIARDYNRRIARYAELASPGQVSAERLTGMLIKSTVASTATKSTAPAPPLNRRSGNESVPPRTFAEGAAAGASPISNTAKRDDGVQATSSTQPASAAKSTSHKERSLLVPSR